MERCKPANPRGSRRCEGILWTRLERVVQSDSQNSENFSTLVRRSQPSAAGAGGWRIVALAVSQTRAILKNRPDLPRSANTWIAVIRLHPSRTNPLQAVLLHRRAKVAVDSPPFECIMGLISESAPNLPQ